eukprot:TRINITY_DN1115_c0_g1_i2.p1 TRINITY_DN1115_c0_g1~~TRINITY_DN1115_c0_g1_i2.p1  ORF type:complete len:286 (+),score=74.19 TRINITY_DN1115_c0_g1_i2:108-965(+)
MLRKQKKVVVADTSRKKPNTYKKQANFYQAHKILSPFIVVFPSNYYHCFSCLKFDLKMCGRGMKAFFVEAPLLVDEFGCMIDLENDAENEAEAGASSSCATAARLFSQRCCGRRAACGRYSQQQPETFQLQPGRRLFGRTPVDVSELPDGYTITVDVPGLTRERVIVLVDEDIIIVAGDYDGLQVEEGARVLRDERSGNRTTFERRFRLPRDVLGDAVAYDVQHGMLKVFLPKKFQVDDNNMEAGEEAGPSNVAAAVETQADNEQWVDVMEDSQDDSAKKDEMSE